MPRDVKTHDKSQKLSKDGQSKLRRRLSMFRKKTSTENVPTAKEKTSKKQKRMSRESQDRDASTTTHDDRSDETEVKPTSAWKTKKMEELGKGDMIFARRVSLRIDSLVCSEEHGRVFKAFTTKQTETTAAPKKDESFPVALKVELASGNTKKWFNTEKEVLLAINSQRPGSVTDHFPNIFDSGELVNYRFIAMSLHGHNLESIRRDVLKTEFSFQTAVRVAIQTLKTVVDLHLIGFHHRDLKPTNFVIGIETGDNTYMRCTNNRLIFMVGFGTCVRKRETVQIAERRFVNLTFGSRRSHNLNAVLDRNDDLESWLYLCVELFKRGSLPWRKKTNRPEVLLQKQKFFEDAGFPGMCDHVPEGVKQIIQKCFGDQLESRPVNVHMIYEVFRDICAKNYIAAAGPYDWETVGAAGASQTKKRRRNTTGTTTADEDETVDNTKDKDAKDKDKEKEKEKEKEKAPESTNLDQSVSILLRKPLAEKGVDELAPETSTHSCSSLDPHLTQTTLRTAEDLEVENRMNVPRAIPAEDPMLKLSAKNAYKPKLKAKIQRRRLPPTPRR